MAADGKMQEHDWATLMYLRRLFVASVDIQEQADTVVDWGDGGRREAYNILSTAFDVKVNAILGILHMQARMQGTSLDDPPVGIAITQAIKEKSENERGAGRIRDAYITMQSAMVGLNNLHSLEWVVEATTKTIRSLTPNPPKRKTPDPLTGEDDDDDAAAEEPPRNVPAPAPVPPSDPPAPRMRPVMSK